MNPAARGDFVLERGMTSRRLDSFARAAMLGLLAATYPACGSSSDPDGSGTGGAGTGATEGDGDGDAEASGGVASGGAASGDAASGGGAASGGSGAGGAATGGSADGSGGAAGGTGEGGAGGAGPLGVISSEIIADLSLADFTGLCDEAGGVVETHAVCGGVVTGPGFSYDSDTDVFTEHTCAGYNTCRGFSCVIDD